MKANKRWVILSFFPHSPIEVYGPFRSEKDARLYAELQGFAKGDNSYSIHQILDVQEE